MSWSADWCIPRPRVDAATLRDVLERTCRAAGYRIGYLADRDAKHTHAGIAIDVGGETLSGCLEWYAGFETEPFESAWDGAELERCLDSEAHDDLVPRSNLAIVDATIRDARVVGGGRGMVEIDRYRDATSVSRVMPEGDGDFADGLAGLSGIARHMQTVWAHGGPALLYKNGVRVETGIDAHLQIAALHPIDETTQIALTDDGRGWRIVDGRASPIDAIAKTESYGGYWETPWSIAARGHELWIANGSDHIYRLRGDVVEPIDIGGIERLVVASDQRIWLMSMYGLAVGDGERFVDVELADGRVEALAAGRDGRVVAFMAGPPAWRAEAERMSPEQAAAKMFVIDGASVRRVVLDAAPTGFKQAVCSEGDLVWASTHHSILAIEPGGTYTRMSLNSNRDANREDSVWMKMCAFGGAVADALGGWDITAP